MQRSFKPTVLLLTAGCFLAFFVFGFTDNLKGATLPPMLAEMRIHPGLGANIFFGEYLGFLVATLITGILADKFGLKLVVILAGVCMFLGVGGYSAFASVWPLSASLFVLGLGLGALELGPNAIIVSLHHERKGLYLNLMAVLHGLGSMIAPLAAGWLLGAAAFSALGVLLAAPATEGPSQVMMLSNLVRLPLIFVSGVFVPHAQMPAWGRWLAPFSPLSYCADLVRVGFGAVPYWSAGTDVLALCAFTVAFILLARWFHLRARNRAI
jgi:fucose permease